MELKEAIEKRRSIRKYENRDVSEETLLELVRCATLAPSAHNKQPWKFQFLKGEIKDQIADILYEKTVNRKDCTASFTSKIIKEAPVLIVVYLTENKKEVDELDVLSIGGAIENILLRATDMGLGSLWIADTFYIEQEMKDILNTDYRIISTVAIGYKNQDPHARPRKPFEEVMITK